MNTIKIYLAESGRIADLRKDFPLYKGQFNDKLLNVLVPTSILAPQFDIQHYIGQISGAETPSDNDLNAFVLANTYPSRDASEGDIIEFYNSSTNLYYNYTYSSDAWVSTQVDSFGTFNNLAGTSVKISMTAIKRNGTTYESKTYFMRYLKTLTYQNVEYALYERKLPKEFTSFVGQGINAPTLTINVVNVDTESNQVISVITSQTCGLDVMASNMLDQDTTIEASDLETLTAQVNENSAKIALKQDQLDDRLETTQKSVVGAINELKTQVDSNTTNINTNTSDIGDIKAEQITQNDGIASNTYNIGINTTNINDLTSRVANLEQQSGVEETYIGQMTGTELPTDTQLNAFVEYTAQRYVKGGDVVIFIQTIPNATDKVYKYTYSIVTGTWGHYEIPASEPASNTSKGIVQGSYTGETSTKAQVNITNGTIEDIYVTDTSDNVRRISEYLNTDHSTLASTSAKAIQNEQDISTNTGNISTLQTNVTNIISGATTVGKATNATNDSLGNNISTTYMTNNAGVTKTQMREYALPRTFNDVSYLTEYGFEDYFIDEQMPIFTVTSSSVGDHQIFQATKTITNATFQLSSKNSYTDTIYAYASANCSVLFRLTTEMKIGSTWETLNIELSDTIDMVAGQIKKLSFASPMNSINGVLTLNDGSVLRQTLEVITQTSQEIEFAIYSNETYPSTFYLNTTSQTIILSNGKLGELPFYDIQGSGDAAKVTFTLPLETQIDDNVEALFSLRYSGETNSNTQLELSYNAQTIQILTPANNGTATPCTVADLSTKFATNFGRWIFTGIFKIVGSTISLIADVDNVNLSNYYTQSQINTLLSGKQATLSAIQLDAVNSGVDSTDVAQISLNQNNIATNATNISALQSATGSLQSQVSSHTTSIGSLNSRMGTAEGNIATIEGKIPTQASSSNQLADKAFVNSSLQTATAYFRGNWATWSAVPTSASNYPVDANGNHTPTSNDYMVVQDASGYTGQTLAGTWRFKYSGVWATDGNAGWLPEYQVNEAPLTSSQLDALNSGATTTNIGQIATNTTNISNNTTAIGNNTSAISGLTTRMGTAENNINAIPNNYVSYTSSQTLTDTQKLQARTNIGAGASSFSGSYGDLSNKPILDTTNTTAQSTSAIETIDGTINLHKVAKTGTASDLIGYSDLAQAGTVNSLSSDVSANTSAISTINGKIPAQATTNNQLADKAFVNSSVQTATANFRGNWATWADVPTNSADYPADYAGSKVPTVNDYLVVQDASGYNASNVGTWRFKYSGDWSTDGKNGWLPEYQVNEEPLTSAQINALNSGITSSLVTQIGTNTTDISGKQDQLSTAQLNAVNSGITSSLVNQLNATYHSTASKSSTYINGGNLNYNKIGRIVIFMASNLEFKSGSMSNGNVIFDGLPRPNADYYPMVIFTTGQMMRVRIHDDGTQGIVDNYYSSVTLADNTRAMLVGYYTCQTN